MPSVFCDQVNKISFNFIWDNKITKIKKNTIIGEREKGPGERIYLPLTPATATVTISIKELPLFYERTLQYWFELKEVQGNTKPCTKKTVIWNNKDIKIDNKMIFFRTWFDKGVSTLENLLDQNLDFLTYEEFKFRYQLQTIFLLIGCVFIVRKYSENTLSSV